MTYAKKRKCANWEMETRWPKRHEDGSRRLGLKVFSCFPVRLGNMAGSNGNGLMLTDEEHKRCIGLIHCKKKTNPNQNPSCMLVGN